MVTPVLIELGVLLLFCAALAALRESLSRRALVIWIVVWALRGAASIAALRLVPVSKEFVLLFYTPLQLAFALALVVAAVHLERQKEQLRSLRDELARHREEAAMRLAQDPLTQLSNRSALERWLDEEQEFTGLIVVCDLDDFKGLNDLLGHLVGDDVLRDIGQLVRSSIRHDDCAFRWGGDEFVICFRTSERAMVEERMRSLQNRLQRFQIRNYRPVSISFSWGLAEAGPGRSLRASLEEADRRMYDFKRQRRLVRAEEAE